MIIFLCFLYFALMAVVFKMIVFAVQFILGILLGIFDAINVALGGDPIITDDDL